MIVTINDADHGVLLQTATPVKLPLDAHAIQCVRDLKTTFDALSSPFSKPAGLAAPQIGYSLQMFIFHVPEDAAQFRKYVVDRNITPTMVINPKIIYLEEDKTIDWEACYSIPDRMGEVERFHAIQLSGLIIDPYTLEYETLTKPMTLRGFAARVVQHEYDHLCGQLWTQNIKGRHGPVTELKPIRDQELTEWLQS